MGLLDIIINQKKYTPKPLAADLQSALEGNVVLAFAVSTARKRKTDLVEAEYPTPASPEEAVYRGRIYSLSGTDPNFPKVPLKLVEMGLVLTPFRFKKDRPRNCLPEKVIAYSNRPWKDDRSQEEKEAYEKKVEIWTRSAYRWLGEHMPDRQPASYEEFCLMKKNNTSLYQQLQKEAARLGRKV